VPADGNLAHRTVTPNPTRQSVGLHCIVCCEVHLAAACQSLSCEIHSAYNMPIGNTTSTHFRVRFAPSKAPNTFCESVPPLDCAFQPEQAHTAKKPSRTKSRTGCQECRSRRVKCDETYPVCHRCLQRGAVCRSTPRMVKWQMEMPLSRSMGPYNSPLCHLPNANPRLLQRWMERISQIMVTDPDNNPLSFPVIPLLQNCPSLVHSLQSMSAGYECHFQGKNLVICLEERDRALVALQEELRSDARPTNLTFLTIFMVGFATPWIYGDVYTCGQEHLDAARRVVQSLVANVGDAAGHDTMLHFIVGCHIYWEMCCALVADPSDLDPINETPLLCYLHMTRTTCHALGGYSLELFCLLASVGRYCRRILDGDDRDLLTEAAFEQRLLTYSGPPEGQHNLYGVANDCLRNHGLMLLYRICGSSPAGGTSSFGLYSGMDLNTSQAVSCFGLLDHTCSKTLCCGLRSIFFSTSSWFKTRTRQLLTSLQVNEANKDIIIQRLAHDTVDKMLHVPLSSPILNMLGLAILTAGSELGPTDVGERKECRTRMESLYSRNRCPPNLWACQLLDELWKVRDSTESKISWPELALQKGWKISLA
jgi:hypothetical protein